MALLQLRGDDRPLVEQIETGIRERVQSRALRPGSRLPSIRRFAVDHGVSRFTVVQAYERLVAAGFVESRRGSGFYVSLPREQRVDQPGGCDPQRAVDVLWLLHQSLAATPGRWMPGCGWFPGDWHDTPALGRALRQMSRQPLAAPVGYGAAAGFAPLRETLARRLNEIGIGATPGQILTTHGASHALDLIGRYFLRPDDTVLVDDPGYFNLFGLLRSLGARLVGVPRTPEGPDIAVLEDRLHTYRPRLYFTTGALHNPTGTSISPACAHRLLRLAERFDVTVVEDDVYGDLQPELTRLASLDQLQRVIYLSSFSKTLAAPLRVGYLAGPPVLVEKLTDLKLLTAVTSSEMNERVVQQVLREGHYRRHLNRLRARLHDARERVLGRFEALGLEVYGEPRHGLFLWCRLPGWADASVLARQAGEQGIVLAPGCIFRPDQGISPWLRFNVAFAGESVLYRFLENALRAGPPPP